MWLSALERNYFSCAHPLNGRVCEKILVGELTKSNLCKNWSRASISASLFRWVGRKQEFYMKILFSDEAHYYSNGYFDKKNFRIWRDDNPKVIIETPWHPQKPLFGMLTWQKESFHLHFFFLNEIPGNGTVKRKHYRAIINDYFWCFVSSTQPTKQSHFWRKLLVTTLSRAVGLQEYLMWGYVKCLAYRDKLVMIDASAENNWLKLLAYDSREK